MLSQRLIGFYPQSRLSANMMPPPANAQSAGAAGPSTSHNHNYYPLLRAPAQPPSFLVGHPPVTSTLVHAASSSSYNPMQQQQQTPAPWMSTLNISPVPRAPSNLRPSNVPPPIPPRGEAHKKYPSSNNRRLNPVPASRADDEQQTSVWHTFGSHSRPSTSGPSAASQLLQTPRNRPKQSKAKSSNKKR